MTRGETPSLLGKYGVRKGEGEGNKMRRRGMEEKYTQQACVYVDCKCFRDYSIVFYAVQPLLKKDTWLMAPLHIIGCGLWVV